ncbi:hypothetical protein GCM10009120_53920 [Sphingobacterium siyangense subsp. cladoniae]
MASMVNIVEPMVSIVEIIKLPKPAVPIEEAARVPARAVLMVAAVPPPAIMAIAQRKKGEISVNCIAKSKVPAIVAKGMDRLSNILSIKGM